MSDRDSDDAAVDVTTRSTERTGSHAVDRELERELVRAALFDRHSAPRIGRYSVGERLGAGASSVVYAARDVELERRVAIKIFVAESSATRRQVQREARALAQLKHHNVVTVYDVGEWNDHAFIAMELITGTTLARWQADPERSTAELFDAYLQAGQGLDAAHRAGLVHRDFKPANVMVAGDGRVVVTDFGLASDLTLDVPRGLTGAIDGSATDTCSLVGTPAYVAPEQRRGAPPHPSADIYSFALALCEALIGWHPMQRNPRMWRRELTHKVPPRLYTRICNGLAEDPAVRGSAITPLLAELARRSNYPARPAAMTPWAAELRPPAAGPWGRRFVLATACIATAMAAVYVVDRARAAPTRQMPEHPPGSRFQAIPLHTLIDDIDATRVAPPLHDDARGAAAARALLLQPLPSEVTCAWPEPIASVVLGDDYATARDEHGHVYVCALERGTVELAASDAQCVVPARRRTLGVQDRSGRVRVIRNEDGVWRAVPTTGSPLGIIGGDEPAAACSFRVVTEPDGRAWIGRVYGYESRDRGRRIALQSVPGTFQLQIVDRARSRVLSTLEMTQPPGRKVLEISPDGSHAVVAGPRGTFYWWRAATEQWQEEPLHFRDGSLRRAQLSSDGQRLLLIDLFGNLEVRTLGNGRAWWLTSASIRDAIFFDDDTVIALDFHRRLWRWRLSSQRSGIVATLGQTVWSLDSNAEVVVMGSESGDAIVVDRRGGAVRWHLTTGNQIYRMILDGDRVVAAGNDGLRVWSWRTGLPLPIADGRGVRAWDVKRATASDGSPFYIVSALGEGGVFAWSSSERTLIYRTHANARAHSVAVSPDGRIAVAVNSWAELILIDLARQRVIAKIAMPRPIDTRRIAFDTATGLIVTASDDGYLRTWSPVDGSLQSELSIGDGACYSLDVRDGQALTAAGSTVALVDLVDRQIRRYHGHDAGVTTVRFSADGNWFVTGDSGGRACLWRVDVAECHTRLEGHGGGVLDAVFGDDGTIFTASHDGTVRYWRPTYDAPIEAVRAELSHYGSTP